MMVDAVEVIKELERAWAEARWVCVQEEGDSCEEPDRKSFAAGRYDGLTQAIAIVEGIVTRGRKSASDTDDAEASR